MNTCVFSMSQFETILRDLHFAIRQLRRRPGFTFTAVAVFALAIAGSTAIFAFVDAALVKPLPYRDPSRLLALYERIPVGDKYHLSYADYLDWKRLNHTLASLDIYRPEYLTLYTARGQEPVSGARISDGFFRTLGVSPFLGRDFYPGEDQTSTQPTVILSYATWQKRFAGSREVVGKSITFDAPTTTGSNHGPFIVIGVMPRSFHFAPVAPAEFWITLHGSCAERRKCYPYYGVARLKGGVSAATAYQDLASIAQRIAAQHPESNHDRSASVMPLTDAIVGDIRPTLVALLSGAALLSLIGLVNISGLLLVRSESRRREMALRNALGASRSRMISQLAVEGFLLAGFGGGIGLILAAYLIKALTGQIPADMLDSMPYLNGLHLDWRLCLFAGLTSLLGGVIFSVAPAVRIPLSDIHEDLMSGSRSVAGRSWRRAGSALVALELAITMALLVSAGLLSKSFYRLLHEDLGMSADHLAILHVSKLDGLTDANALALQRQIISRMSHLPGVVSVGISWQIAVTSGENFANLFEHFRVFGRYYPGQGDEANTRTIGVGYFETLRARLLQGRFFAETDDAAHRRVAIINRTFANQLFPGEDPLGKRLIDDYDQDHPVEIIGVVGDIKDGPLDMSPTAALYEPFNQNPSADFYVTLRTSQSSQALFHSMVDTVHQIDPGPIADEQDTMLNRINSSPAAYLHRSAAWLVGSFAGMALLIGGIGLYGVVSYSVGQRTREIGVRMALGAQRASIYWVILFEAGWLAIWGAAGGTVASVAAGRFLRTLLFGVSPWDVATLATVICLLIASALLASYFPARRAASVNPIEALRAE
jgi:predicted permease